MQKPKLWKYKSGAKAGKLRPRAKKYLSQQLKLYRQTGLTASERLERATIKTEQREEIQTVLEKLKVKKRLRYQIVRNSDYSLSLRAIVINPHEKDEKEIERRLLIAIEEFIENNKTGNAFGSDGEGDWWTTEGLEQKYIAEDEDKGLIEGRIYVEENIKGVVNFIEW